jgi:hypothetical protein
MYEINYSLPDLKQGKYKLLKMVEQTSKIKQIIQKYFNVYQN